MTKQDTQNLLLNALLPAVIFDGWSERALKHAAQESHVSEAELLHAFPNGIDEALAFFIEDTDKKMQQELALHPLSTMKLHEKVELAIMLRFAVMQPHREAVRKAVSYYASPFSGASILKRAYDTADSIWRAIGDHPTDFSFYTKRLSLASIYATTLMFWLDDISADQQETRAFLQRRLKDLLAFHRTKKQVTQFFSKNFAVMKG